ncbi:MAG: YezD family protein [Chloroflexi bacterium]|nr:YezD family protein [Chloroflexota bacterium]
MAETTTHTAPTAHEEAVLAEVLSALRSVRYGYVQITLQDARVVQIDTLEKKRLDR